MSLPLTADESKARGAFLISRSATLRSPFRTEKLGLFETNAVPPPQLFGNLEVLESFLLRSSDCKNDENHLIHSLPAPSRWHFSPKTKRLPLGKNSPSRPRLGLVRSFRLSLWPTGDQHLKDHDPTGPASAHAQTSRHQRRRRPQGGAHGHNRQRQSSPRQSRSPHGRSRHEWHYGANHGTEPVVLIAFYAGVKGTPITVPQK